MMQKSDKMYVTSQIIWGLKPPFSVNSVDVDFTSNIKTHNTCSGDIEDTYKV